MPRGIYKRIKPTWNKGKKGIQIAWNKGKPRTWKSSGSFKKGLIPWNKNKKGLQIAWNKNKKMSRLLGNKYAKGNHPKSEFKKGHGLKENNPNWKGGKSFEPYTIDWTQTLKRSIRERDKYTCQICKESQKDEALCVHHIDHNKENCNPSNLISLCRKCHINLHHENIVLSINKNHYGYI